MFYIACTRFNNDTYKENLNFRIKHDEKVIYGPDFKIRDIYPPGSLIFVVEMNNETNKIQGIGLIKNLLVSDKKYKIYENGQYNRYIYRGNFWISREDLMILNYKIVETFDTILFKGKSHMKYRSGITIITDKLFSHWTYELSLLKKQVKTAFLEYFYKNTTNNEICVDIVNLETNLPTTEVEFKIDIIRKKRNKKTKTTQIITI